MLSINSHAFPALLPILHVLHHVVAPKVLHAPALATDAVVDHHEGGVVAEMKIFAVPGFREETSRSVVVAWKIIHFNIFTCY